MYRDKEEGSFAVSYVWLVIEHKLTHIVSYVGKRDCPLIDHLSDSIVACDIFEQNPHSSKSFGFVSLKIHKVAIQLRLFRRLKYFAVSVPL